MHGLLDHFRVDISVQLHAVLEVTPVVRLRAFRLDVLLNRVDLALVANQAFLDLVEPVVDVRLQNLVLDRVVLDPVVGRLVNQLSLVLADQAADHNDALLLLFKVLTKLVEPAELVLHFVFHPGDALLNCFHFFVNSRFKRAYLFEVSHPVLLLDSELGCCHLSVVCLPLLKA